MWVNAVVAWWLARIREAFAFVARWSDFDPRCKNLVSRYEVAGLGERFGYR